MKAPPPFLVTEGLISVEERIFSQRAAISFQWDLAKHERHPNCPKHMVSAFA